MRGLRSLAYQPQARGSCPTSRESSLCSTSVQTTGLIFRVFRSARLTAGAQKGVAGKAKAINTISAAVPTEDHNLRAVPEQRVNGRSKTPDLTIRPALDCPHTRYLERQGSELAKRAGGGPEIQPKTRQGGLLLPCVTRTKSRVASLPLKQHPVYAGLRNRNGCLREQTGRRGDTRNRNPECFGPSRRHGNLVDRGCR